jgi:hypothetical protein
MVFLVTGSLGTVTIVFVTVILLGGLGRSYNVVIERTTPVAARDERNRWRF